MNNFELVFLYIFGFMHEFWTIPTTDMTNTRSQNYTNMMVGEHRTQKVKVMVVMLLLLMLLFDVFVPTSAHPLLLMNKWFVQMQPCQGLG
jgi:hypothetical protein